MFPKADLITTLRRLHDANLTLGWDTEESVVPSAVVLYHDGEELKMAPIPVPDKLWDQLSVVGVLDALEPEVDTYEQSDYLNGHYRGHAITCEGVHQDSSKDSRLTVGTYHDGLSAALLTLRGEESTVHLASNFDDVDDDYLDRYAGMPLYRNLLGATARTLAAIDVYEMEHKR